MKRSARNIRWIEQHCRVPEGKDVGKPVRLRPWQKRIIRGIYDTPTRRIIVSVGRKNAKTALSAMLLLLHLAGPEAMANSQLYSAAQSRDQAAVLFNLAAKMVRMDPDLSQFLLIRDSIKELACPELGTLYKALSAEASTAFGLSPVFVVHDELGQVTGPRSKLYEALETGSAAHASPLSVVISTQAPDDGDLLSILIDDAKSGHDPTVKLFLWEAPLDGDPFDVATIKAANPAFGDFQNSEIVLQMADDARRMPAREAEFRNLVLNQRVRVADPYVTPSVWAACGGDPAEDWGDRPVYCGLDLSESRDLTAFVACTMIGDVLHVRPTFWTPEEGLEARARQDRAPYDLWAQQGWLETCPGSTVRYEWVAQWLAERWGELNIAKVAFDRWNWPHFAPWLEKAGFTEQVVEDHFEEFGQGTQSMSPALRDLDGFLLDSRLRHGNHPVLTMCAMQVVVHRDPRGNRRLAKPNATARIDGMVALAMAAAVLARDWAWEEAPSYTLQHGVLVI